MYWPGNVRTYHLLYRITHSMRGDFVFVCLHIKFCIWTLYYSKLLKHSCLLFSVQWIVYFNFALYLSQTNLQTVNKLTVLLSEHSWLSSNCVAFNKLIEAMINQESRNYLLFIIWSHINIETITHIKPNDRSCCDLLFFINKPVDSQHVCSGCTLDKMNTLLLICWVCIWLYENKHSGSHSNTALVITLYIQRS